MPIMGLLYSSLLLTSLFSSFLLGNLLQVSSKLTRELAALPLILSHSLFPDFLLTHHHPCSWARTLLFIIRCFLHLHSIALSLLSLITSSSTYELLHTLPQAVAAFDLQYSHSSFPEKAIFKI